MLTSRGSWLYSQFIEGAVASRPQQVGIELERFLFRDLAPIKYFPDASDIFQEIAKLKGWKALRSPEGYYLGFDSPYGKISLEPGSQMELSTLPFATLDEAVECVAAFDREVAPLLKARGLHWVNIGVNPTSRVDEIDVIPLPRYRIMTEYLGKRDQLGTSMMRLTGSLQINLDYRSEQEGIEMYRAANRLVPFSYALFANSPFYQGKETGHLSFRKEIWKKTDPDRTGIINQVFNPDFDFANYVELIFNQPLMYAQNQQGDFVAANGINLYQIEEGKLEGVVADETNQMHALRQYFPEVRLKPGYLEIRAVDAVPPALRYAATAFWMGLLYCSRNRRMIIEKLGSLEPNAVGLRSLLAMAKEGLVQRGKSEEGWLDPLEEMLEGGKNQAEKLLDLYRQSRSFGAVLEASSEHFDAALDDSVGQVDTGHFLKGS